MPQRTRLVWTSHVPAFTRSLDSAIKEGLRRSAGEVVQGAQAASTRYDIDAIVADTETTRPFRGRRGWAIMVTWRDWRALLFDRGTYRRLGAASRRSRKSSGGGPRGVKPVRFIRLGTRKAFPNVVDHIARAFRS